MEGTAMVEVISKVLLELLEGCRWGAVEGGLCVALGLGFLGVWIGVGGLGFLGVGVYGGVWG